MKKGILLIGAVSLLPLATWSQSKEHTQEQVHMQIQNPGRPKSYVQDPSLAISFLFNDFRSAAIVRQSSLWQALREDQFGKISEMSPGLGLSYIEGIHDNFDVTISLAGSFLDYPIEGRAPFNKDNFLIEGDVSIRGKMFTNRYIVSPFLQIGAGTSFYAGYHAAFIPAGAGLQINFFDEAYFLMNAQYRIPVTNTASYHFFYSIGLAGKIGLKKQHRSIQQVSIPVISTSDRDGDGVVDADDVCPDTKGLVKHKGCPA